MPQITVEHVAECARHIERIKRARGGKLTDSEAGGIASRWYDERDLWYKPDLDPKRAYCAKCKCGHIGGLDWCGKPFVVLQ